MNGFDDIFSNLAVINSFSHRFVFGFFPKCDESGQVLLIIGIWQWVAFEVFWIEILDSRIFGSLSL